MANVLQLFDSFNQGGTEWQTVQLTCLLHESGKHRLFLASLSNEGPLRAEVERLSFHDIPSFPLQNFYNAQCDEATVAACFVLCARTRSTWFTRTTFTRTSSGWQQRSSPECERACTSRRETEGIARRQSVGWSGVRSIVPMRS